MRLPPLRVLLASVSVLAVIAFIALVWSSHQSSVAGSQSYRLSVSQPSTTAMRGPAPRKGHAAPDLEAMLPNKVNGVRLRKGSTVGSVVFGSDAFSRHMTSFLASVGKAPADLRFANAQDPSGSLDLETGVFQLRGVKASMLRQAIVNSTRPDAPGLRTFTIRLSGKRVTMLVYPGGSVLYLYAHRDLVFYVGTQSEGLAAKVLGLYP